MNIDEEIKRIEEEIRKTQYNKATEHHIGRLKAKLARLKEMKESSKKRSGKVQGVKKSGNAMVSVVGYPSVGKSTLFTKLTNKESEIGDYDFTTINIIPGMMEHKNAKIQILDMPGLIEGAQDGRGRGKEVLSVIRISDLIVIVTDINKPDPYPIIKILEDSGIRLNRKKPNISLIKKDRGGLNIQYTVPQDLDDELIREIMREFRIVNADVIIRDRIDMNDLIDFLSGNRSYVKGIFVLNKIDEDPGFVESQTFKELNEKYNFIVISAKFDENIELLKEKIYEKLDLITIKLKPPDKDEENMVIRRDSTVEMVCRAIHKDFVKNFKYALVWGPSAKYPGQRVGLDHVLMDGDKITIFLRK